MTTTICGIHHEMYEIGKGCAECKEDSKYKKVYAKQASVGREDLAREIVPILQKNGVDEIYDDLTFLCKEVSSSLLSKFIITPKEGE